MVLVSADRSCQGMIKYTVCCSLTMVLFKSGLVFKIELPILQSQPPDDCGYVPEIRTVFGAKRVTVAPFAHIRAVQSVFRLVLGLGFVLMRTFCLMYPKHE